ncbi:MAG: hypothetical protein GY874_05260 [Desulfobacteraceae bacterium]|nr:hypothetical protein [Desulfobacteraceae bacterium]
MNKIITVIQNNKLKILIILLLNILLALIYIRISPACYQYHHDDYSSIAGLLLLSISLPLYWVCGVFVSFFLPIFVLQEVPFYLENPESFSFQQILELVLGFLSGVLVIVLSIYLLQYHKKLNIRYKDWLLLVITMIINVLSLRHFCASMSV